MSKEEMFPDDLPLDAQPIDGAVSWRLNSTPDEAIPAKSNDGVCITGNVKSRNLDYWAGYESGKAARLAALEKLIQEDRHSATYARNLEVGKRLAALEKQVAESQKYIVGVPAVQTIQSKQIAALQAEVEKLNRKVVFLGIENVEVGPDFNVLEPSIESFCLGLRNKVAAIEQPTLDPNAWLNNPRCPATTPPAAVRQKIAADAWEYIGEKTTPPAAPQVSDERLREAVSGVFAALLPDIHTCTDEQMASGNCPCGEAYYGRPDKAIAVLRKLVGTAQPSRTITPEQTKALLKDMDKWAQKSETHYDPADRDATYLAARINEFFQGEK